MPDAVTSLLANSGSGIAGTTETTTGAMIAIIAPVP
jgi:hypothetical protein